MSILHPYLIVGSKDKLHDDNQSNESWLGVEAKSSVEWLILVKGPKHTKDHKQVHLHTEHHNE